MPSPAEVYDTFFVPTMFVPWGRDLLSRAAPRPGERVLDVACGSGAVTRLVAPMVGADGRVVGLDVSPAMLAVARSRGAEGASVEFVEGSGTALPFPDASFDLVVCQQGLQFFPDRYAGLREMRRVLVSGGRLALSVWRSHAHNPAHGVLNAAIKARTGFDGFLPPFSYGDADVLESDVRAAGFASAEVVVHSMDVVFPDMPKFLSLSIVAASAVIPALQQVSESERAALSQAVEQDALPALAPFARDGALVTPMSASIAIARA